MSRLKDNDDFGNRMTAAAPAGGDGVAVGALARQIEEARAALANLERMALQANCSELDHDWVEQGGRNCGCHADAACSVPVFRCSRCKTFDYGDNAEAADIIARCDNKEPYVMPTYDEELDPGVDSITTDADDESSSTPTGIPRTINGS